jgi:HlyD family secretion protein
MRKREGKPEPAATEEADTSLADTRNLTEGVFLMKEGEAEFVPVTLGLRGETYVEILGMDAISEPVIVGPYRTLRRLSDGDAVRPEKAKKEKKEGDGASDKEPEKESEKDEGASEKEGS